MLVQLKYLIAIAVLSGSSVSAVFADDSSPIPPKKVQGSGGNPGLSETTDEQSNEGGNSDDGASEKAEPGAQTDQEKVRADALQCAARSLGFDLDQRYAERVGQAPSGGNGAGNGGGASDGANGDARRAKIRATVQRVLSEKNRASILALVARNASRAELINSAIGILNAVISSESAAESTKISASNEGKLLQSEENQAIFQEELAIEIVRLQGEESIENLKKRQQVELQLAAARNAEKLAILERERLERELSRSK